MIRAVWFTVRHFWECRLCRWHWRAFLSDLSPGELRYVARTFGFGRFF